MLAQYNTGVIPVDNISFPPRLNLGGLFRQLQRYQFHETSDHFRRAQHFQSFELALSSTQVFVVIELRPEFRILRNEAQYLEALTIKPLVHITSIWRFVALRAKTPPITAPSTTPNTPAIAAMIVGSMYLLFLPAIPDRYS